MRMHRGARAKIFYRNNSNRENSVSEDGELSSATEPRTDQRLPEEEG